MSLAQRAAAALVVVALYVTPKKPPLILKEGAAEPAKKIGRKLLLLYLHVQYCIVGGRGGAVGNGERKGIQAFPW